VLVVEGDLKNLVGVVHEVTATGRVVIQPEHEQLKDLLDVLPGEVRKYFRVGDHVRVIAGEHSGETGLVVAVDTAGAGGGVATVLSDATKAEVRAFTKDLAECGEATHGLTQFGDYALGDLVALDQATVGVIINVEKEACQVLTNRGLADRPEVRTCRQPDLKRRILGRKFTTPDAHGTPVGKDMMVSLVDGPFKGKRATVLHAAKGSVLFLQCRGVLAHAGHVCVRGRSVKVDGSRSGGGAPGAPARPQGHQPGVFAPKSPGHALTQAAGGGGGTGAFGPGGALGAAGGGGGYGRGGAGRRDNALVGVVTKITKGPLRGYVGKVVDATATTCRVELQAQARTVTVKREYVAAAQAGIGGGLDGSLGSGGGAYGGAAGGPQGAYGPPGGAPYAPYSAAPQAGARTPAYPGAGARTPAYPGAGARTPAYPGAAGAATPFREAGARTPFHDSAWNPDAPPPALPGPPPGQAADLGAAGAAPWEVQPGGYSGYGGPGAAPTPQAAAGATPYGPGGGAPTPQAAGLGGLVATPGAGATPALAATPGGALAHTPASASTPAAPQAGERGGGEGPGADGAGAAGATGPLRGDLLLDVRALVGLVVRVGGPGSTRVGAVASVDPAQGRCGVADGQLGEDGLFQAGTGSPATVALSAVSLVPPVRNAPVRIVCEKNSADENAKSCSGQDGKLLGFVEDDREGIVKMDADLTDIKILSRRYLAMIHKK